MNKKEQQYVEELKMRLALKFTEGPIAPDIPIPSSTDNDLARGFLYNVHTGKVSIACSSVSAHSVGRNDRTDSQQGRALYSTRLLALKALRYEIELQCAQRLRAIDIRIEDEIASDQAE